MRSIPCALALSLLAAPSFAAGKPTATELLKGLANACAEVLLEQAISAGRDELNRSGIPGATTDAQLKSAIDEFPGWNTYLREVSVATCTCAIKPHVPKLSRARNPKEIQQIGAAMWGLWEKKPEVLDQCSEKAVAELAHLAPKHDPEVIVAEFIEGCSKPIVDQTVVQFQNRAASLGKVGYTTVVEARKTLESSPVWNEYIVPVAKEACSCLAEPYRKRMLEMTSIQELGQVWQSMTSALTKGDGNRCMEQAMLKHESGRTKW